MPSKRSLLKLHERHLSIDGSSTKKQKHAIVEALGGTDQILSTLLKSNALINDEQLESLHQIISNPHNYSPLQSTQSKANQNKSITEVTADKGYGQTIKYSFFDNDMLLHKLFNKRMASNIKQILYSRTTAIFSTMIFFLLHTVPNALYITGLLSVRTHFVLMSVASLFFFFYLFGWLLTANKAAMKLIGKEFVFWFKLFYLLTYLVTIAWIRSLEEASVYYVVPYISSNACLFTLTMITDYLNISQSSKIILTAFALASFAYDTLYFQRASLLQSDIYKEANVLISAPFGFDPMNLNIIDICSNSAQILAIFSLKQIISTIRKPQKASLIKINPLVVYEDQKQTNLGRRHLKIWRIISITWWSIYLLICLVLLARDLKRNSFIFATVPLVVIILCLHVVDQINGLYACNIFIIVLSFLCGIGSYFYEWGSMYAGGCLFGFGLTAIYTLKVIPTLPNH